jgi:hypothetical protein
MKKFIINGQMRNKLYLIVIYRFSLVKPLCMLWVFVNCAMVLQNASVSYFFNCQLLSMAEMFLKVEYLGRTGTAKNLFYRHFKPNKPTKEGPLSFVRVLIESPLASTVCRGHLSLVSLNLRLVLMKSHFYGLDPRQHTLPAISSEKTVIRKAWRQHTTFFYLKTCTPL